MATSRRMLEGYRVLDFTQVLAGPTTTRYMAEMGAEVIKVEFAPDGDISRGVPYLRDGRSAYYVQQNRGKRSLCLDLKNPAAAAIIRELIPKVDVVVENYAPGVIGRLGFRLRSGARAQSENHHVLDFDLRADWAAGESSRLRFYRMRLFRRLEHDRRARRRAVAARCGLGDITTGVHALAAIVAALLHRERTGEGQYVETSLLDCYFSYNDMTVRLRV